MPFNGSGVFYRVRNWVADATAGIKIRADYHDSEDDGFAAGLSDCITRNGQTLVVENIPFNSKRITGLANPINAQDAATKAFVNSPDNFTGTITTAGSQPYISSATGPGYYAGLMVMGAGGTNEAFMSFHRPLQFAVNFGLGNDGNFHFGGWSYGEGIDYKLWSTRDFNYIPVNKAGDTMTGTLVAPVFDLGSGNYANSDGSNYIIHGAQGISFQSSAGVQWGYLNAAGLTMHVGNISTQGSLYAAGDVSVGGQVFSGSGIVSGNGAVAARQLSGGGNYGFYLQNSAATTTGALYFNVASNSVDVWHVSAPYAISLAYNGVVKLASGWQCKQGIGGFYGSNASNMYWGAGMTLYVDTTGLGVITTSSDYRIKQDMRPLPGMWEVVKQLNPIRYEHKNYGKLFERDGIERWGFLAHELQDTLLKSAASGAKDEENVIQSPSWPPVVAALTKALQEAMERIEALENGRA